MSRGSRPVAGESCALLNVRVVTRAARRALRLESDGTIKACLNAPPVGGEANRELIQLLAAVLRLPKSRIKLAQGSKSRNKVVRILGLGSKEVEVALHKRLRVA